MTHNNDNHKICFSMLSCTAMVILPEIINFNRARIRKIRYNTNDDFHGIILISISGLNKHKYIKSPNIVVDYFYSFFVDDVVNHCVNIHNIDDFDYYKCENYISSFTINIYNENQLDSGITVNNPCYIELEFY